LKFINLSDITLKYDSHKLTFSPKLLVRYILGAQKYTIYIYIYIYIYNNNNICLWKTNWRVQSMGWLSHESFEVGVDEQ
jgi:hypothetical protein